jgi:hypothetical protein
LNLGGEDSSGESSDDELQARLEAKYGITASNYSQLALASSRPHCRASRSRARPISTYY